MLYGRDFAAATQLLNSTLRQLPYRQQLAARSATAQGFRPAFGFAGMLVAVPERGMFGVMPADLRAQLERAGFRSFEVEGRRWYGWALTMPDLSQEERISRILASMPPGKARVARLARGLGAIVNFYGDGSAAIFDGPVSTGLFTIGGHLPPTLKRELRLAGYVPKRRPQDPPGTLVWTSYEGFVPTL